MDARYSLSDVASASDGVLQGYREILEEHWFSYLLFLPTLLFLVFILWIPFFKGIWMSFHQWPSIGDPTFVGLENYIYLLNWEGFITSLKVTAIFAITTLLQLATALLAALAIVNIDRFKSLLSGIFLLPYTMAPVVTGTIWLFLLHPDIGPVFGYLTEFGILQEAIYWGTIGKWALTVIIGVTSWTFWPFMFIIFVPTLQNIPQEHYETGKIYGANRVQTFLKITLPQLKSAILVAVTIRMVWNLAKISQPFQMTGGGPGFDTSILGILLYRFAYIRGSFGAGFAIGMFLLALTGIFTVGFLWMYARGTGRVDRT